MKGTNMFQWDEEKKKRWGIPLIINMMLIMVLMICLSGCDKEAVHSDSELKDCYIISDTLDVPSSAVPDAKTQANRKES